MATVLPEEAPRHIVDPAVTGDVRRSTVSAVIPREFRLREALHPKNERRGSLFKETPPHPVPYFKNFETNGDVSPRRR